MTNVDTERALRHVNGFRGVFSKDMLPKKNGRMRERPMVNLENYFKGNGTHWVAVYGNEYFDPFGLPPPDVVRDWMANKDGHSALFNSSMIQDIDSLCVGTTAVITYLRGIGVGRPLISCLTLSRNRMRRMNISLRS